MKLVAQSLVPSRVPFLHLGYIAVSSVRPHAGLFSGIWVFLCVGVILAVRAAIGKTPRGYTNAQLRLSRRWPWAVGGLALFGLAALSGSLAFTHGKRYYHRPELMNNENMRETAEGVEEALGSGAGVFDAADLVRNPLYRTRDGWFKTFRVEITATENEQDYTIVSAGPDGEFGTTDDLHRTRAEHLADRRW